MSTVHKMVRTQSNRGGNLYQSASALANGDTTDWIDVSECVGNKAWQATGTFGAGGSVQLEVSLDGTNGAVVGSPLTAAGYVAVSVPMRYFRFNVTAGDGTTAIVVNMMALPQRGS